LLLEENTTPTLILPLLGRGRRGGGKIIPSGIIFLWITLNFSAGDRVIIKLNY
jgi:hypothetical protein